MRHKAQSPEQEARITTKITKNTKEYFRFEIAD
jgi:hypothetical protein